MVFQVSDVILPSGKQYSLRYDQSGNLHVIFTQEMRRHKFNTWSMLSTTRQLYTPPEAHGAYVQDFYGNGKLKQIMYPSLQRHVTFTYNRDSLLLAIYFDWTDIAFATHHVSNKMKSIRLTDQLANFTCEITVSPDSALYTHQEIVSKSKYVADLANASVHYHYDRNFRVVSMETRIGSEPMLVVSTSYNSFTGRMLS